MTQIELHKINALFVDIQHLWKLEDTLKRAECVKDITFTFKKGSEYVCNDRTVFEEKIDFTEKSAIDAEEILETIAQIVKKKLVELTAKFERYKLIQE